MSRGMARFIDGQALTLTWLADFGGGGFSFWLYDHGHPGWWVVMAVCFAVHMAATLWLMARLNRLGAAQ